MSKIGIMGGTFNPIHLGHVLIAENAYYQYNLDKVLFMPNKVPAYKEVYEIVDERHRVNMIKLAIMNNSHFQLSTMELERAGITYTVDTLNTLHANYKTDEFYFIMGADSLMNIEHWREPKNILSMSNILVAPRDGDAKIQIDKQIIHLKEIYNDIDVRIGYIESPSLDVSSRDIRERLNNKGTIRYMVNEEVLKYIEDNFLYRSID